MGFTLDPSCPAAPLLPYLLNFNASAAEEWAQAEANSFGSSVPVALILTIGSALLLLFGERLTKVALFLCGALVAFVVSLLVTDAALSVASAGSTAGCVTIIAVPLLFGLLGGAFALWALKLAFACAGFAAGAAAGQFIYVVALHHVSTGVTILSHDLMYFLCLLALAIPGAILMSVHREGLMILATAALGAVGLVPGLALLILSRIDARFLWVTDPSDANAHRDSPFVYGQALAVLAYFPIGVLVQRHWAKRSKQREAVRPYVAFEDGARGRNNFHSNA